LASRLARRRRLRQYGAAYLLIAPVLLAVLAFLYLPSVFSLYWSFTKYNGFTPPRWVGLDNYTHLLGNARFRQAVGNTVLFVVITMGVGPVLGLLTALLLNGRLRLRGLFRTVYFLPVTISLVATATIWKMLLTENGLANQVLGVFGVSGHAWLADPGTALPAVAAASIWQGFGFETVVFLAALQSVPGELLDAADVDGAGPLRRFWHVTLPALRPTVAFVYVYGVIGAFQVFDQVFVMTQGGPLGSTNTVVASLVDRFNELDLGSASATAYLLLVVLAGLSFMQLRAFRKADA
jgi:multiple sugar transport system permease protein